MKIVGLKAENFKRLRAVELSPDGTSVVIAGRNAQGKSSVLDAIWAALAGKSGSKEWSRPIRDGESKASVVVELDDLRVERKWTPSGSTLTVGPRDGKSKFNSPQSILDNLIGKLAFDPLAFAEADAKTQRAMLLALTGLQDEVDTLERERKATYDARTDANREVKRLRAQLDGLGDVPLTAERVDTAALAEELGRARQRAGLQEEWRRLEDEISRMRERQQEVETEGRRLQGSRTVQELTTLLETADEANQRAYQFEQAQGLQQVLSDFEASAEQYDNGIKEIDSRKVKLLQEADLPVPGLGVDDEGVTFNGVPFIQASAAERLRVSVAMAMAANPEVRVICIKDASLLDADSRQLLADMAAEKDYQIWYEVVGDGGPTGIVIEDGEVAGE